MPIAVLPLDCGFQPNAGWYARLTLGVVILYLPFLINGLRKSPRLWPPPILRSEGSLSAINAVVAASLAFLTTPLPFSLVIALPAIGLGVSQIVVSERNERQRRHERRSEIRRRGWEVFRQIEDIMWPYYDVRFEIMTATPDVASDRLAKKKWIEDKLLALAREGAILQNKFRKVSDGLNALLEDLNLQYGVDASKVATPQQLIAPSADDICAMRDSLGELLSRLARADSVTA